jgi:hypothetical protein
MVEPGRTNQGLGQLRTNQLDESLKNTNCLLVNEIAMCGRVYYLGKHYKRYTRWLHAFRRFAYIFLFILISSLQQIMMQETPKILSKANTEEETHSMMTIMSYIDPSSTLSEDSSLAESKSSCSTNEFLSTAWEETSKDLQSLSFRRTRRSGSIDPGVPNKISSKSNIKEETHKMLTIIYDSDSSSTLSEDSSLAESKSSCSTNEFLSTIWEETSKDLQSLSFRRTRRSGSIDPGVPLLPLIPPPPLPTTSENDDDWEETPKMKNCKKTSVGSFHPIPTQVSLPNTASFIENDDEYEDIYNDWNTSSRHSISLISVRTGQSVVASLSDDEFTFESCSTDIDLHSKDSLDTHSLVSIEDSENDFREGNEICDMADELRDEPSMIGGKREAALWTQQRLDRKDTQKLDHSICSSPEETLRPDPLRRKISNSLNSKHLFSRLSESFLQPELRLDKKLKVEDMAGHRRRTRFKACKMILERKIVYVLDKMHKKILSSEHCEDEIQVYDSIMASPSNPQDDYNASKTGLDIEDIEDDDDIQLEAKSSTDNVLRENKRADLRDKIHRIENRLARIRSTLGGSFSSLGEDSLGSRRRDSNTSSPAMSVYRKSPKAENQDPQGRLAHFQLKKQLSQKKLQVALNAAMDTIKSA